MIPLCANDHWILTIIEGEQIYVYNSYPVVNMKGQIDKLIAKANKELEKQLLMKQLTTFKQQDSECCGFYTILNIYLELGTRKNLEELANNPLDEKRLRIAICEFLSTGSVKEIDDFISELECPSIANKYRFPKITDLICSNDLIQSEH